MRRFVSVLITLTLSTGAFAQEPAPAEGPAESPTAPAPDSAPPTTPIPAPPKAAPPEAAPPAPSAKPNQPLALPPHPAPTEPAVAPVAPSPAPAPQQTTAFPVEEPVDMQLYGGILLTGIGAGLLVLGGVAVSRIDDLQNDPGYDAYRRGFDPSSDVCERAAAGATVPGGASPEEVVDICDEATSWEITNYVALPGGIVMLGMGLYLSLTSDTAQEEPSVSVVPILGPTQAGLTMSGRF